MHDTPAQSEFVYYSAATRTRVSATSDAKHDDIADLAALRAGVWGGWLTAAGAFISGPLSLAIVQATHPQPTWQTAELFARKFHPIQTLPFFSGFALLSGFVTLIAALHRVAPTVHRARTTIALIVTAAFAALISFNYVVQTTFVPGLVASYSHEYDNALTTFSMTCPASLAWALEMWGYALIGIACWLVAPVLQGSSALVRWTRALLIANAPLSIVPALLTAFASGWVLTPSGIAAFILWNILVIALGGLAALTLSQRIRESRVR